LNFNYTFQGKQIADNIYNIYSILMYLSVSENPFIHPVIYPHISNIWHYAPKGSTAASSHIAYLESKALDTITNINNLYSYYSNIGVKAEALTEAQQFEGVCGE